MSGEEILRKLRKPQFSPEQVSDIVDKLWGLKITSSRQLDSYDDCNYYFETSNTRKFILKIYNGAENPETIEGFAHLFTYIASQQLYYKFPTILPSINNALIEYVQGDFYFGARLFSFIEGVTLQDIPCTIDHFQQLGTMLATFTLSMKDFYHASFTRVHAWDLKQFDSVVPFIEAVEEEEIQTIILAVHAEFSGPLRSDAEHFRWSVIQGDCNGANIIVDPSSKQVIGLIDFGDAVYTWTLNDIATAMCYALLTELGKENEANKYKILEVLFKSYTHIFPLNAYEVKHLKTLVCVRLSLSTAIGAYSIQQNPEDEYLKLHAIPAKKALEFVWNAPSTVFTSM